MIAKINLLNNYLLYKPKNKNTSAKLKNDDTFKARVPLKWTIYKDMLKETQQCKPFLNQAQ